MEIIFLGTSCAEPTAQIGFTSFLVDTGQLLVLVDASGNPVQSILAAGHDPLALDLVVLTHYHADHIAGYPALIQTLGCMGRRRALTVVCGQTTGSKAQQLLDVLEMNQSNTGYPIRICDGYEDPDLGILLLDGKHSIPTSMVAIRWANGRLLYTSDTAFSEATAESARGYQTLIHEATFSHSRAGEPGHEGHSSAYQAGLCAAGAGVERLFLCHICWHKYRRKSEIVEEVRSAFQGEIVLPEPYLRYPL
ncbi:MAG: MBL fold metallo-hydrolase [Spirochaetales bacterium]|nr:MBL fold metallo-hydrolase [Spirochaetales bacterium]